MTHEILAAREQGGCQILVGFWGQAAREILGGWGQIPRIWREGATREPDSEDRLGTGYPPLLVLDILWDPKLDISISISNWDHALDH